MKRCPTCNQTFADDTLSFCLEDGTPLVAERPTTRDSDATLVSPSAEQPTIKSGLPPTQSYGGMGGKATRRMSSVQPPMVSQPAALSPRQPKVWPWVVGILAVGFLSVLAIVIVAIVLPRAISSSQQAGTNVAPNRSASPRLSSSPSNEQSNAPTDSDEVLNQLTELENEWAEANAKGDKDTIDRILAEEFVGVAGDGTVERKAQYLADLQPDPTIKSQTFSELDLSLKGNSAILTGINSAKFSNGKTERFRFTDTFVWRDGRWQAISSQASRIK